MKKNLLIVRTDAIGDYILFRNFIEVLADKYKDYKITLCGNIIWKNLALTFDKEFIDDFIWVDKSIFHTDRQYRHGIFDALRQKNFDIAINPMFSRDYISNTMAKLSFAPVRITNTGDLSNITAAEKVFADVEYTEILDCREDNIFEFYRNKEFFENLLETKLSIKKPYLNTDNINTREEIPKGKFAVIFPDTTAPFRQWGLDNYAEVTHYIACNYQMDIVIAGGNGFKEKSSELISKIISNNVIDITGKTTLSELAKILSEASLLVSGDTAAYHMAAAVDTKVVCISNGNTFGRFIPYPEEINDKIIVAFPQEIQENLQNWDYLSKKYKFASTLDINSVTVDSVKCSIDKLMRRI